MGTVRWVGNAADVKQSDSVTFALTWADADTVTTTINTKSHVVTMGSAVTTATLAATAFKRAFNGTASGTDEYTANFDASSEGDFAEMTATSSAGVVTITSDTPGKPFTITGVTAATAGDGTAVLSAEDIAATGKNHFNNVDNWDTGVLPVDDDAIVFARGSVSCLHGLAQSAITPASLRIDSTYEGYIGLHKVNEDVVALPYNEYRETSLTLGNIGDVTSIACTIGDGSGPGSRRINLDFGTADHRVIVKKTGVRQLAGIPACLLDSTNVNANYQVLRGDVAIGLYGAASKIKTIDVGFVTAAATDAALVVGENVTLTGVAWKQTGGVTEVNSAVGTATVLGGTLTVNGSGAVSALNVGGGSNGSGTVKYNTTGTATAITVNAGGHLDCSGVNGGATVTTCTVNSGGAVTDNLADMTWGTFACPDGLENVNLRLGRDITDVALSF